MAKRAKQAAKRRIHKKGPAGLSRPKIGESSFRALLESAPDAMVIVDPSGHILFANAQTERLFGYPQRRLLGQAVEILVPERFRAKHGGHRTTFFKEPRGRPMGAGLELYGQRRDGTEFPAEISLSPLKIGKGLLATAAIRDITERKRVEEQIQRNLESIRALREIDQAITSTLDLRDVLGVLLEKIDLVLPYAATTLGLFDKASGILEPVACRNLDEKEWRTEQWRGGHGIPTEVCETRAPVMTSNVQTDPRTPDPEFFRRHGLVSYLGVPLIAKDEALGVLSFYTRQEHQFSGEEVDFLKTLAEQTAIAIQNSQLYEQIKRQAAELERANRLKDEFLSIISHELRTPLNVVMGYAGILKDGMLGEINPKQEEVLEKLTRRAHDQLLMVDNILFAIVLEAKRLKLNLQDVTIRDFFAELRETCEVPANKELRLHWDYDADLPVIKTDGAKLRQILQNLIDNAIKFTNQGSVTISARIRREATGNGQQEFTPSASRPAARPIAEFKVADTGVGIPHDHLCAIFEKFRQVDSSEARPFGGVGMGLYIVKRFSEFLGAKVQVESEPGRGSTFTVAMPLEHKPSAIGY